MSADSDRNVTRWELPGPAVGTGSPRWRLPTAGRTPKRRHDASSPCRSPRPYKQGARFVTRRIR